MTQMIVRAASGLTLLAATSLASAAQFTIFNQVCQGPGAFDNCSGSAYAGAGVSGRGFAGDVIDGGFDAYDAYGDTTFAAPLTLSRQVDVLSAQNVYRWLDTFTNTSSSTIATTVTFGGNLGSDSNTTVHSSDMFSTVTSDGVNFDPVIAHIYGNNAFAQSNMSAVVGGTAPGLGNSQDNFEVTTSLTLAPGQSATLMFLNFLARDNSDRSGDLALASSTGASLVSSPLFTGLSASQISSILNFGPAQAPEPPALALLGVGLLGLGLHARRRRAS